jgi:hypothetical protein
VLENMIFLHFLFLLVSFALLSPDPDTQNCMEIYKAIKMCFNAEIPLHIVFNSYITFYFLISETLGNQLGQIRNQKLDSEKFFC